MAKANLEALIADEIRDAESYIDGTIQTDRITALEYYRGNEPKNFEEGRSQVISRDVRDAVHSVLPSLMRVFFGSERAVEFVPQGPEDVESAEQATDYINWIVLRDNPGFQVFHAAFKDSLYQKAGIVKYWLDERRDVEYQEFTELTDEGLGLLSEEDGVEIVAVTSKVIPEMAPQALMAGVEPPQTHDVTIKRTNTTPHYRLMAVPPEEFLVDRYARDIDSARYVGHRRYLTVNDLVAMGYDPELVKKHKGSGSGRLHGNSLFYSRVADLGGGLTSSAGIINDAEAPVLYVESYVRFDLDEDGYAELLRVCSMGEGYKVVHVEPVTDRGFVAFCPDPEPHIFFGHDLADLTIDIQKIQTNLKRNTLDSLAFSIYPRTVVLRGQANMDDVLNTEIGAVIRENVPGAVRTLVTEFVGQQALPIMAMIERERDMRLGTHNMALDADALQSTTAKAVEAQVTAARQHLELIARIYAETGMTRLFQGLLKLVVANADRAQVVRLRNKFVEIDPRLWNASMDVSVNVGLGNGLEEERMRSLGAIAAAQKDILTTMGPNNPAVTLGQYTNTLAKMVEMSGWKDSGQFVNRLPPNFQMPTPPPQPTPEQVLAEVEREKAKVGALETAAKIEVERDKLLADTLLRAFELQGKYPGMTVDIDSIRDALAADRLVRTAVRGEISETQPSPAGV